MKPAFVIFDLDGTLYRSETTFVPAIGSTLRDFNLPVPPPEEILPLLRYNAQGYARALLGSSDSAEVDAFRKRVREYELTLIPERGSLYPGIEGLLSRLKRDGFEMAICTNAETNYLEAVIEKTRIGGNFTCYTGNDSNVSKAELAAGLLSRVGRSPEESVLVGDSDSDESAAFENGISFVEALWGYGNASITRADYRAADGDSLETILKSLPASPRLPG